MRICIPRMSTSPLELQSEDTAWLTIEHHVSYFESERDNAPKPVSFTWQELTSLLSNPRRTKCHDVSGHLLQGQAPCKLKECPNKFGKAWSPVRYLEREQRGNEGVAEVTVGVWDLDHVPDAQLPKLARILDGHGFAYLIHSTHRHAPPHDGAYRLVIPLAKPVTARDWSAYSKHVAQALELPGWDTGTHDPARLFFLPSAPEGAPVLCELAVGRALRGGTYSAPRSLASTSAPASALGSFPEEHREALTHTLEGMRECIAKKRVSYAHSKSAEVKERATLLKAVLKGEAIAESNRSTAINKAATYIANSGIDLDTPPDVAVEFVRLSIARMDVAPEGLDHWLKVFRESFTRALWRRQLFEDKIIAERNAAKEAFRTLLPAGAASFIDPSTIAMEQPAPLAEGEELDSIVVGDMVFTASPAPVVTFDWKAALKSNEDGYVSCGYNATIILACDERLKGSLRFNKLTKAIEVNGGYFAGTHINTLFVAVSDWLQSEWSINLKSSDVKDRILRVAMMNSYDPLYDYLSSKPWDGGARISDFLITHMGAVTVDALGADITEYVRKVSTRFFLAAAARGLDPGVKADNVLIVEGEQGIMKSTAFDVLGSPWYTDTKIDISNKDSRTLASIKWIIELGELAALKGKDNEALKTFLSAREDTVRIPYAATHENFARHCVFVGTTNHDQFLSDTTGNRRYWPVRCLKIDLERIKADRDQLWSEAVARYRLATDQDNLHTNCLGGERWWFEPYETKLVSEQTQARMVDEPMADLILDWWVKQEVSKRGPTRGHDVAVNALLMPYERITRSTLTEIGLAMQALGFGKQRVRVDGRQVWVYKPNDYLMRVTPATRTRAHLALVEATNGVDSEAKPS